MSACDKYGFGRQNVAAVRLFSTEQRKKKEFTRIFISHQYPVRFDSDTTGIDDEPHVQYWEMRVEGRLLDDVSYIRFFQNNNRYLYIYLAKYK